jgi:hypothetical protein
MQFITCCGLSAVTALALGACNSAKEPRPGGNDHGVQLSASTKLTSGSGSPVTEVAFRDLDPDLRREIGLDLEPELDPGLRHEIGLDLEGDLDPQLRREVGLDPVPELGPDLRRELGLDPESARPSALSAKSPPRSARF